MSYLTSTKASTEQLLLLSGVLNNLDAVPVVINSGNQGLNPTPIRIESFEDFCKKKRKERKQGSKKLGKLKPSFFKSKEFFKDSLPKFEFRSSLF